MNKSNRIPYTFSFSSRDACDSMLGVVCCHSYKKFFVFVLAISFATHPQSFSLSLYSISVLCKVTMVASVCAQDAFDSIHIKLHLNYRLNCIFIRENKPRNLPTNREQSFFLFHYYQSPFLRALSGVHSIYVCLF